MLSGGEPRLLAQCPAQCRHSERCVTEGSVYVKSIKCPVWGRYGWMVGLPCYNLLCHSGIVPRLGIISGWIQHGRAPEVPLWPQGRRDEPGTARWHVEAGVHGGCCWVSEPRMCPGERQRPSSLWQWEQIRSFSSYHRDAISQAGRGTPHGTSKAPADWTRAPSFRYYEDSPPTSGGHWGNIWRPKKHHCSFRLITGLTIYEKEAGTKRGQRFFSKGLYHTHQGAFGKWGVGAFPPTFWLWKCSSRKVRRVIEPMPVYPWPRFLNCCLFYIIVLSIFFEVVETKLQTSWHFTPNASLQSKNNFFWHDVGAFLVDTGERYWQFRGRGAGRLSVPRCLVYSSSRKTCRPKGPITSSWAKPAL